MVQKPNPNFLGLGARQPSLKSIMTKISIKTSPNNFDKMSVAHNNYHIPLSYNGLTQIKVFAKFKQSSEVQMLNGVSKDEMEILNCLDYHTLFEIDKCLMKKFDSIGDFLEIKNFIKAVFV